MSEVSDAEFRQTIDSLNQFCDRATATMIPGTLPPFTPYYCQPGYDRRGDLTRLTRMLARCGYVMSEAMLETAWSNYAEVMDGRVWRETFGLTDIDHFLHFVKVRGELDCSFSYKLWFKHNLPWGSIAYWTAIAALFAGIVTSVVLSEQRERRRADEIAARCQGRGYALSQASGRNLCVDTLGRLYDPSRL